MTPPLDGLSADIQQAIDACQTCLTACNVSIVRHRGAATHGASLSAALECAIACQTAIQFLSLGSRLYPQACDLCADACEACYQACSPHHDDASVQCAAACVTCIDRCRGLGT